MYHRTVWGTTYKNTPEPICILQKRVMRIVNNAENREHTNIFCLKSHTLKFRDLVEPKTAFILCKARNNLLFDNVRNMFMDREGVYNLRGKFILKQCSFHTTLKSMCVSIWGVILGNALDEEVKQSKNIRQFKKM